MSVNQLVEVMSDTVLVVEAVRYMMRFTNRRLWRFAIILFCDGC